MSIALPSRVAADRAARRAAIGLRVFGLLMLGAVIARVVQLQAFPSDQLRAAVDARVTGSSIDAVRGDLLDRRGRLLASTRIGYRVVVDPVAAGDEIDRVIVALAGQLGVRPDAIGRPVMRAAAENARRRAANAGTKTDDDAGKGWLAGLGFKSSRAEPSGEKGLIRYVPVSDVLTRDEADAIGALRLTRGTREIRLPGVVIERRSVRELVGGDAVAPLIGKVGYRDWSNDREGKLGTEKLFQDRLEGTDGRLNYSRDALGEPLWVDRGAWSEAVPGGDVRLSLDAQIQNVTAEELARGVEDANAAGGRAIVFDPHSGEILAMVDLMRDVPGLVDMPWWDPAGGQERPTAPAGARFRVLRPDPGRSIEPALARNRCIEDIYEPGSTFKPFAWALAHEQGKLDPNEKIKTGGKSIRTWYGRRIEDVTARDELTWDDVLRFSSNIGMYHATERLTQDDLRDTVLQLGFGSRSGLGMPGEAPGLVLSRRDWNKYTQTSVGMGYAVGVTPVQMVRAFSVFARRGEMAGTLPGVRITASGPEDSRPGVIGDEVFVERVFSPETAIAVRQPLKAVVERMDQFRLQRDKSDVPVRYTMFGKSGTAYIACTPPPGMRRPRGAGGYYMQYNSSFLVAAPAENPEIVVLVVIDDPDPALAPRRLHYGSATAGPVVRRIVERVLPYLGVPVSPPEALQPGPA